MNSFECVVECCQSRHSGCDVWLRYLVAESGRDIPVATFWSRNPVATFRLQNPIAEFGYGIWLRNLAAEFGCGILGCSISNCGYRMRSEHSWCLTLISNKRLQYAVTCFRLAVVVVLSHCYLLLPSNCCFRRELRHIGKWLRAMLMSAWPSI